MSLINSLQSRYAVKKMNGQAVNQNKINQIIEAIRLAPSSSGLQPFKVIVITNQTVKQNILPIAFNQSQVVDCSHLLVFVAWENYTKEKIEAVFQRVAKERGTPFNADYANSLISKTSANTAEQNFAHTARQAYIALGVAICQAAELKVDSTPMEGFNNSELDTLLQLNTQGLKSVLMLALGTKDEKNDWLMNLKKVRTPQNDFIIEIK